MDATTTMHAAARAPARTGAARPLQPSTRARAYGGDATTATDAIERERAALVRFARRITRNGEDAEDAVQTAWLIAARRPDVAGPTAIGWVLTVIRHDAYRRRAVAINSAPIDSDGAAQRIDVSELPAAPEQDLDALLDLRAALAACRRDELLALLGRVAGHSYREISECHGWTYTKVNRCVSEGRARVRELVAT